MDWVKVIFGCLAMVGIAVSLAMLSLSRGVKGAPARPVLIGVTALLGIVSIGLFWMLSSFRMA